MTMLAGFLFDRPETGILGKLANNPREAILLLMAIFCAAFLATAWILMLRKWRWFKRHHHHRRVSDKVFQTATANTGQPENVLFSTHTHRRRREKYTKRNPTLAETGGLPPKRAQSDTPPPQPQLQFQQPQTMRNG